MNYVLIAIIIILAVLGILGMRKGLIRMFFSLISTVLALVVAALFSTYVSDAMKGNEKIVGFFDEKIGDLIEFTAEEAESREDTEQESFIDKLPLPEAIKDSLKKNNVAEAYESAKVDTFQDYVCRQITNMILNAIAFVITFLVAVLALTLLANALDLIAKLPGLKQINAVGGLAAGLAEGVLLVWILFVILTMFAGTEIGQDIMKMIAENKFLDYLYKNNLLSQFVMRK